MQLIISIPFYPAYPGVIPNTFNIFVFNKIFLDKSKITPCVKFLPITLGNLKMKLLTLLENEYEDKNPLLLCVMNGSLVTMGHLLPELNFPLEIDYIHASRYGEKISGGDINWIHKPKSSLVGREVILVEDEYRN